MQSSNSNSIHSDFWLPTDEYTDGDIGVMSDTYRLIKINTSKKIIQNFVNILTHKNIPVEFSLNEELPTTDGEVVRISSKCSKKSDFDVVVGLALHEASHILLTDFAFTKSIWQNIPNELYDLTKENKATVANLVSLIYNVIEDRYIDNYVYNNAIGYRGYYVAFYRKYFYNSFIDEMLQSNMYRVPSIDAYLARIINIMNKNTDLTALPGLKEIYDLIDLKNIQRFANSKQKFHIACEICRIILSNVESCGTDFINDSMHSYNSRPRDGVGTPSEDATVHELAKSEENKLKNVTTDNKEISMKSDMGDISDKSFKEVMDIKKSLDVQRDLLAGKLEKLSITQQQNSLINNIEKCGVRIVMVGDGLFPDGNKKIECIFVEKLTKSLIDSPAFPLTDKTLSYKGLSVIDNSVKDAVENGIRMGVVMGKKLRIRNETNMHKFLRKNAGKIDKRLLAEIGTDNEDIFYQYKINSYDKISLHISVDSSGSMMGDKWNNTITLTTAICKAASMIDNFDVSVSFRSTIPHQSKRVSSHIPYVVYAYDSRVDKFSKVKQLFPLLRPSGCTPEGLSFEPILDYLDGEIQTKDKYFINISDGEPFLIYSSPINNVDIKYVGKLAATHTKNQVNKIKNRGYNILSYYIEKECIASYWKLGYKSRDNLFETMYGKDAVFIDVNNVFSIIKTLNTLFLKNVN